MAPPRPSVTAVVLAAVLVLAVRPAAPAPVLGLAEAMKELDLIRPSRPRPALALSVPLVPSGSFRLAEQRGRVVMVNFWATWCAPCREEMPAMERLWRHYRERGFVIVAVSVDADAKRIPPFVAEHRLSFPIAHDPRMDAANAWGVRGLPTSFLVDREGTVTALALGPRAWDARPARALVEGMLGAP
jgi:peroxiredoxin